MSDSTAQNYPTRSIRDRDDLGWFSKAEAWLDEKGKGAWIAAMVLGFVFVWPVGLAILFYMIWSKRMFSRSCSRGYRRGNATHQAFRAAMKSSGNSAFDAYKADTLRRLEDEQANFEAFLERLRDAKDKAEFDQFMEDRARKAREGDDGTEATA
ncbi:DUF2852 domain-containing protein [Pelagovum pacificum]|uniref:DUF2852 domain-containing protein n=1 Tax=Pelagovum pacificum TaxID=2588711 RepID=A0A5C5GFZ3_9RHOB|nr:DUF2852 domain-containing protein [Pelagovum pacificum]QQA44416.1 DUF2852 domain-containing protein [Pelagovum pacificum]TNY32466.1 DUF2852 domain-containing protein [Pelagovum pacificum]